MEERDLIACPGVAALMRRERDAIETGWAESVRDVPRSHYGEQPPEELLSWTTQGVEAIIESLESGSVSPLESHVRRVTTVRRRLGFGIGEVINGLLRLWEIARTAIRHHLEPGSSDDVRAMEQLDIRLRFTLARLGEAYAASMRESVELERNRTALLLEATQAAGESLDIDTVLDRAASFIASALEAPMCEIFLGDETADTFRIRATTGDPGETGIGAGTGGPLDSTADPIVAASVSRLEPVVHRAGDRMPVLGRKGCSELGVGSIAALPIVSREKVIALAVVTSQDPDQPFTPGQVQLAAGVAGALAPAIAHARLYDELRRSLAETRTLQQITSAFLGSVGLSVILELACRETQHLTRAGGSAVILMDGADRWIVECRFDDGADVAEECLREALLHGGTVAPVEPILINDLPHGAASPACSDAVRSLLAVPLRVHGDVIGVLQLMNKAEGFGGDDLRLVSLVADQVAVAIEHARLHERQETMAVLEERTRIAQDLHDSVTQSLYGVTTLSEAALRTLRAGRFEPAAGFLQDLRDSALQSLREMRLFLFHLFPPDIEKEGLVGALHTRMAAVEKRAGLRAEFLHEDVEELPRSVQERLYRIAQEALNNTLKHADASEVTLRLGRTGDLVILEITDNGSGFDATGEAPRGGLGLPGMERRAAKMGGTVEITSEPGRGTTVRVEIPVRSQEEAP